jgi:hypothetical protein
VTQILVEMNIITLMFITAAFVVVSMAATSTPRPSRQQQIYSDGIVVSSQIIQILRKVKAH